MADDVLRQIEKIKTLGDRSMAYSTLLHLQRRSADDPSSMEALSLYSPPLTPLLLSDIHHQDEEISAQALKCLGFMVYHPSIVPTISEEVVQLVLDSLVKLITTTQMKAICNLGVWCISIQQFKAAFVESRLYLVLRAVVHALDNPFGSLSTTFEAIQAVVKLATQLRERMREMSNIWAPSIYRRLLRTDKRERDMSERCLLKIKSIIYPSSLTLSKAIAIDLKQKLLPMMVDMLHDHGNKVHTIQAWGWYICLLGSNALKNRQLLNEMLKIPESTFTDPDPQVQISSLVAWKGLVDALISPQIVAFESKIAQGDGIQKAGPAPSAESMRNSNKHGDGLLKRIKVIMMPIRGIMSSKCDLSVRLSCLNTWHYLLHKLDLSVNQSSVAIIVLWPILEVIFSRGPNDQNICLWTSGLDLLDEFVLSKVKDGKMDLIAEEDSCYLANGMTSAGPLFDTKGSWKEYPIKWLPWELSNLNFHLKMINILVRQGLIMTVTRPENGILAFNAALRIFSSVLKGVQVELKMLSSHYVGIQFCIKTILNFTKEVCEDISKLIADQRNESNDLLWVSLHFVEAIREELEPSILESSLYRVSLDLIYINDLQSLEDTEYSKVRGLEVSSFAYMDMVSPVIYVTILHLSVVVQSILNIPKISGAESALQHSISLLFSCNPSVNLYAVVGFLYMHVGKPVHGSLHWLAMWRVIAKALKENIDSVNDLSFWKTGSDNAGYSMVYWFLCYPLLVCSFPEKVLVPLEIGSCSEFCLVSLQEELEWEHVIEVWKSLFDSLNRASQFESSMNTFVEGLCELINRVLDENISMLQGSIESCLKKCQNIVILSLFGEVASHILKHIQVLHITLRSTASNQECSNFRNSLELVARFLRLSLTVGKANPKGEHVVICRVFAAMACLVGRLCLKQDIILLMEMISDPLVQWLSSSALLYGEMQQESTLCQLQCLWEKTLDCLQRSQPSIVFDYFFLTVHASLLQAALDHPHSPIADATVAFWKATYGQKKVDSQFPQCLVQVLHKLSRNRSINLQKDSPIILAHNNSSVKQVIGTFQRYTSPMTKKRILKGIDFMEEPDNDNKCIDIITLGSRRKRLKVVKLPMEAQEAHQQRDKDLNGHLPGVDANFSRGFKHPPEKQELRKPEYILEMLRRAS